MSLRDTITTDYKALRTAPMAKSSLSGNALQGAISYAKDELRKAPADPTLQSWLTIIAEREMDNAAVKGQLDELKDFLDSSGNRIIPAPVVDRSINIVTVTSSSPQTSPILSPEQIAGEKAKFREKMKDFSPDSIETSIRWMEGMINLAPDGINKSPARGLYGSMLLDTLRQNGLHLSIQSTDIIVIEPMESEEAKKMQEKLNTLVRTNTLSLETLKLGLLYSSPTFAEYAPLSKTQDGRIDPKASIDTYKAYADKSPKNPAHLADKAVIASLGALRTLNFQQVLAGYSDMGLAEKFAKANPKIANAMLNPTPPGNPPAPASAQAAGPAPANGPVQNGANVAAGKAGEFAGTMASNIGGFASGVTEAVNTAFREGGAIGGLAVLLIGIIGLWKGLNKDWKLPGVGETSGWTMALGLLGGKTVFDMIKKYGSGGGTEEDKKGNAGGGDGSKGENPKESKSETKPEPKPNTLITLPEGLSPSEKVGVERIQKSESLMTELRDKDANYPATPDQYMAFLTVGMHSTPVSKLLSRSNAPYSIFSPTGLVDPTIGLPSTMDPKVFKRLARVYITGIDISNVELANTTKNHSSTTYSEAQVEKKYSILPTDTLSTAITKTTQASATPALKPTETLTEAQVIEKIGSYEYIFNKETSERYKGAYQIRVTGMQDGNFQQIITITDASRFSSAISSIDPIMLKFDKNGDLLDKTSPITGKLNFIGKTFTGGVENINSTCTLSQQGKKITCNIAII